MPKPQKQTVVLFQEGRMPRVYKNPANLDELRAIGKVLIDPKIPQGIPPHRWYVDKEKIKVRAVKTVPLANGKKKEAVSMDTLKELIENVDKLSKMREQSTQIKFIDKLNKLYNTVVIITLLQICALVGVHHEQIADFVRETLIRIIQ